jgi:hypothetical protein
MFRGHINCRFAKYGRAIGYDRKNHEEKIRVQN